MPTNGQKWCGQRHKVGEGAAMRCEDRTPTDGLTALETDLLSGLAEGLSMDAVARRCGLSDRTVRRHMRALCDRLDLRSPTQAVVWAVRRGLI